MASRQQPMDPGRTLNSWKEIAAYLGVSVRTAQIWEAGRGLPVHRAPGGVRSMIYSLSSELDAWRQAGSPPPNRLGSRRAWWVAALAACACAGIAVASFLWPARPATPVALRLEGSSLVVLDERNRELWHHSFDTPFYAEAAYTRPPHYASLFRFADIDGDGRVELLFIRMPADPVTHGATLYCFSDVGKTRWQYETRRTVSSRQETFSPLFIAQAVAIAQLGKGKPPVVVVSSVHGTYYPNQVAVLSGAGRLLREYWHSGQMNHLETADLDGDGVDEIYAAGTNNGYNEATLVVLDPHRLEGASLETKRPEYQLLGFPPPRERARILFGRSCLIVPPNLRNVVRSAKVEGNDVVVETGENGEATLFYRLDRSLNLIQLGTGDGFVGVHHSFRQKGLIDHDFSTAELEPLRKIVHLTR